MSDIIPHDCPVCRLTLRDVSDVLSYEEYECCTDCQDHFVFRNLDAWKLGSRPTSEEIEAFRQQLMSRASYLHR
jgi:hypothetical protein